MELLRSRHFEPKRPRKGQQVSSLPRMNSRGHRAAKIVRSATPAHLNLRLTHALYLLLLPLARRSNTSGVVVSYPSHEGEGLSAALDRSSLKSEIGAGLQASLRASTNRRGSCLAGTLASTNTRDGFKSHFSRSLSGKSGSVVQDQHRAVYHEGA